MSRISGMFSTAPQRPLRVVIVLAPSCCVAHDDIEIALSDSILGRSR